MIIKDLIWDDYNKAHIARHEVIPDEVEEVCAAVTLAQQGNKGRVVLIGPTKSGRILEIVLHHKKDDLYYVVTAHTANRKDRKLYNIEMEKQKNEQN